MNHAPGSGASPQRLLKRIQDQVGVHRAVDAPADDAARKHIDDEGRIDEPRPGSHVGEIGYPELIRPSGSELALDQICRIIRLVAADGGSAFAITHSPLQPDRSHQSFDGATGDRDALTAELSPDFACAVDLEVLIPDAANLAGDSEIAPNPGRQPRRLRLSRLALVVG